jgi:large subunit ribosomal protein L10
VVKVGEVISADLADLLSRMNIRASEMGLEIKAVYEKGIIIPKEDLILDVDSFQKNLELAHSDAYQVALKVAYPTTSTIVTLLSLAMQNAKKVAMDAEYITNDIIFDLIVKVNSQAVNLAKMVGRAQAGF